MAASYTQTLTYPDTLTITAQDRVVELSILAITGTTNIIGGGSFQGKTSTTAPIPQGTSETLLYSAASPLEYLEIIPTSGASASILITV